MEHEVDVLIVGAGLSGVGAACRFAQRHPRRSVAVLEARDAVGGTWDLFRYPGVRSDSDMFTLSYPFRPWREPESMADGPVILRYVRETAAEYGVDEWVRLRHRVRAASWSSRTQTWTVTVDTPDGEQVWTCRWLYLCTGYYRYDHGHEPAIAGLADFAGPVVHPHGWPEDLEVADKRVLVIGSGATAVSLVPALAAAGAHVTMLQRSPTWMGPVRGRDAQADALRRRLPAGLAHRIVRARNIVGGAAFYRFCRSAPGLARKVLLGVVARYVGTERAERDFNPTYDPWDQRFCAVRDADLFRDVRDGRADVVTDTITTVTRDGVRLASGRELAADVLVTATGLEMLAFGDVRIEVDGEAVDPGSRLVYRGALLEGVPNFASAVGYINASWTLRADLTARYTTRLIAWLDARGLAVVVPRNAGAAASRPILDLDSGYARRGAHLMPRQGERAPWRVWPNYLRDVVSVRIGRRTRDLETRTPVHVPEPARHA